VEGCGAADGEACVIKYGADAEKREAAVEGCGAADGEACVIKYGADTE
jgi:hypothetical protein